MTTISNFDEEGRVIVLAQVFVTEKLAESLVFEILEVNAGALRNHIGTKLYLTCDGDEPFWGELMLLEPCRSTASGLRLLRNRLALKGVLKVYPIEPVRLQ